MEKSIIFDKDRSVKSNNTMNANEEDENPNTTSGTHNPFAAENANGLTGEVPSNGGNVDVGIKKTMMEAPLQKPTTTTLEERKTKSSNEQKKQNNDKKMTMTEEKTEDTAQQEQIIMDTPKAEAKGTLSENLGMQQSTKTNETSPPPQAKEEKEDTLLSLKPEPKHIPEIKQKLEEEKPQKASSNIDTSESSFHSCENASEASITNEKSRTATILTAPLPSLTDPDAIRIKFIFANRDGTTVMLDCKLSDTVGEVKGALLSVWPEELPACSDGYRIRLICMGKGILMPDARKLSDCQVPVFETHATPINVSVKPSTSANADRKMKKDSSPNSNENEGPSSSNAAHQGCFCVVL